MADFDLERERRMLERLRADYADLRVSEGLATDVTVKDGKLDEVTQNRVWYAGIRCLVNGAWGFAVTSRPERLAESAQHALRLARLGRGDVRLSEERVWQRKVTIKEKKRDNWDIDRKAKFCLELDRATRVSPRIKNVNISLYGSSRTRTFVSSEGAAVEQTEPSLHCIIMAVAESGGVRAEDFEHMGGRGGLEFLKNAEDIAARVGRRAVGGLKAVAAPGGVMPVVVDSDMAGTLAHEAVGHGCEGDTVQAGGSALAGMIGKQISAESITIFDDPTMTGKNGYYVFDDEGVKARRTVLVQDGILAAYLHSRSSAAWAGASSTGHGRAQSATEPPIVRMSNTGIATGDMSADEMFEGIKRGVYVEGARGGQVLTKIGEFVFTAMRAWLIERGRLTSRLRDVTLSGNILETLKNVEGVGGRSVYGPSTCGKGAQSVPVTAGGPVVRFSAARVGGQA